jgi:hypothetical protein
MATIKIGINGFGRIGRYVISNALLFWTAQCVCTGNALATGVRDETIPTATPHDARILDLPAHNRAVGVMDGGIAVPNCSIKLIVGGRVPVYHVCRSVFMFTPSQLIPLTHVVNKMNVQSRHESRG